MPRLPLAKAAGCRFYLQGQNEIAILLQSCCEKTPGCRRGTEPFDRISGMSPTVLLVIYCLAIPLGSLAGGWIPLVVRLTHTRLQLAMSFVSGAMLGVGLLHLLPHAYFEFGAIYPPVWWLTAGFCSCSSSSACFISTTTMRRLTWPPRRPRTLTNTPRTHITLMGSITASGG